MPKDPKDILKRAMGMIDSLDEEKKKEKGKLEEDRKNLVLGIGNQIAEMLRPLMERIVKMSRLTKEDIKEAISELPTPQVNVPDIRMPNIPTPQVTVKAPIVRMPDKMTVSGDVSLSGHAIDPKKPIPVILTDSQGKSYLAGMFGGSGGINISKIRVQGRDTQGVTRDLLVDDGGRLQVDVVDLLGDIAQGSGVVNSDTIRVVNVTDVATSVNVAGFTASVETHLATPAGNTIVNEEFDAARVISAAEGTELGRGVQRTFLVADQAYSVRAISNTGVDIGDVDVLSLPSVTIGTVTPSVEVKQVSGFTNSVNVVGFAVTVAVVGNQPSDVADDEAAPIKIGGVARTANPAAVGAGDRVSATFDDVGRQLFRPVQVRDLLQTAYASLTTGTETTLLAGVAGVFFDLVYIMGTNNSDAAVTVDIRSATVGGIVTSIRIPANGTAGVSLAVPLPQDVAADTWTADLPDITGTTVTLGALFSREV